MPPAFLNLGKLPEVAGGDYEELLGVLMRAPANGLAGHLIKIHGSRQSVGDGVSAEEAVGGH